MKHLPIIIAIIIALIIGFCGGRYDCSRSSPPLVNDTITFRDTVIDTVRYDLPVPVDSIVLRYQTVKLPVPDSAYIKPPEAVAKMDSVYVEIPIYQKEYHDSTYQAWVSGYNVNLDSINIFQRTITQIHRIRDPPKRWGLGIQIGVGYCGNKTLRPYVGFGIHYNILNW